MTDQLTPLAHHLHAADEELSFELAAGEAMNYALAHNNVSPLRWLTVGNASDQVKAGLRFEIAFDAPLPGPVAAPCSFLLPPIEPHSSLTFDGRLIQISLDATTFAAIDEAVGGSMTATLSTGDGVLRATAGVRLLARDEWWAAGLQESLAAFVTPRAPAVQQLLSDASDVLGSRTGDPSLQGYQGGIDRAHAIAAAIYDAMRARGIRYIDPPASFEATGQKIRSAQEVLVDRFGTCLDLATTYSAALEAAGLNPVLVIARGHAFAGHLTDEQQLPEMVLRDPRMIATVVDAQVFSPLETTKLCAGMELDYRQATAAPRADGWWSERLDDVVCLIDVRTAHRTVRPLPAMGRDGDVRVVEIEREAAPSLPAPTHRPAPEGPAPRGGRRPERAYPPRVERWRNSLLDLSFRNPLLNMKVGRTALDLHVPSGSLGTLEDIAHGGRSLTVLPHDQIAEIHLARGARTAQDISADELRQLLVSDHAIFAACTAASYATRMRGIHRRAKTILEETGANNLFLTLGTLLWEDGGREARAPLFLLPVTLRARRGGPFTFAIDEGAYAQPNQCLLEKLRVSKGLTIPQFQTPDDDESGIDLAGSLQAIRMAVLEAGLPFTVDEAAALAIVQFSTLQLWQDMSENWETFLANPVVRHLVETPTDTFADPAADEPVRSDAESRAFCPIPIDGSQLEAVTCAEAGRSFVLEGPPGTGKSQTITNLIANALGVGKTVLFVAEKQAALDVVQRRLDAVGLGSLCLDLHGKDQTPEQVRKQLREALSVRGDGNQESWGAIRARHQAAVERLGRYPAALHEPGPAGLSAWTAVQSLLTLGEGPAVTVPREIVAAALDTEGLYRAACDLRDALYDLGAPVGAHAWRIAARGAFADGDDRTRLAAAVEALRDAAARLPQGTLARLLEAGAADDAPALVAAWARARAASGRAVAARESATTDADAWVAAVAAVRAASETLATAAAPLLETFTPAAFARTDLDQLLAEARVADAKLLKGRGRKAVAAKLSTSAREGAAPDPKEITKTLEALTARRAEMLAVAASVRGLAGVAADDAFNPLAPGALAPVNAQIAAFEAQIRLVQRVPAAGELLDDVRPEDLAPQAVEALEWFAAAWSALREQLRAPSAAVAEWAAAAGSVVAAVRAAAPVWAADAAGAQFVHLSRWIRLQELLGTFERGGLSGMAEQVRAEALQPEDIEPALRRGVARAALDDRLSTPALAGFDGVDRDRSIERFSAGAEEMRRDMVVELPAAIAGGRSFSPDRLIGKVGALDRELARKRGGRKIRELFAEFGPIIGELTPCLMMSPHSVARFLPPNALDIDLVVFDEASQIKVAEAIGAMGRAKATVVVGDSQQMPPSNYMSAGGGDDDEPDAFAGIPADMESVLSEAVESKLPRLWLSWHYRSKHESLISFSNLHYYEGRLSSFPRPPVHHADLGVVARRVDGTYERGGTRVNRVEADAIVEEIRRRLAGGGSSSIGVVTFNVQQRDLIMDLLEECGDPAVTAALADEEEPLFVKNLENVQGDERDVILFSLAFSPDPRTGRLPLNFGPLIQAGGEKRLNVAVTRARIQIVLFASFDPADIDLSRSSSVGLAHLRAYLEMAGRAAEQGAPLRPAAARDRHREDVVRALQEAGLTVETDVGLSEFTVDVGVAATPEGPWTALFLDGRDYAGRATVNDRESLPQAVLVGAMGWAGVQRIWLPDWLRNREEVLARIREAVQRPAPPAPVVLPAPAPAPAAAPAEREHVPYKAGGAAPPARQDERSFEPAHDRFVGLRETLDLLGRDRRATDAVRAEAAQVIVQEGPVAVERVARIVARRFDLQRVAAKRTQSIVGLIPRDQLEVTGFGTFAWAADQDRDAYAEFRPDRSATRAISEIAPREFLNGMIDLARAGKGIEREEMVRETAAQFGFHRLTERTRTHVESVLDHWLREGRLVADPASGTIDVPAGGRA